MDHRRFDALTRRIFTITTRRSAFAGLAGVLAVLTGWLPGRSAGARRRSALCRSRGGACFPDRGITCCGNLTCRRGECRCRTNQRVCGRRCIGKHHCCRHRDCGGGQRCRRGRCQCSGQQRRCGKRCVAKHACCPGETRCDGTCVNLTSSKLHCGACGLTCAGTAACQQGVCVAGATYREVRRWDAAGLQGPLGVAVDREGIVYVTENTPDGQIWKFSGGGTLLHSWPATGQPFGIAVSPGGTLYVATDELEPGTPPVVRTYNTNGTPGFSFLIEPDTTLWGLAIGANGNVYVASPTNGLVQRFSATGDPLQVWPGPQPGGFDWPSWLATAPNGDVYVTEFDADRVTRWSATGALKGQWGSEGNGDGEFDGIDAIAVDPAGFVYITDLGNQRVQKFTASGGFVGIIGGAGVFVGPAGIAVTRTGMVYVADYDTNEIVQFSPD